MHRIFFVLFILNDAGMNQYVLHQERSGELQLFPPARELVPGKNSSIQLNLLPESATIPLWSLLIADTFNRLIGIGKNTISVGYRTFVFSATYKKYVEVFENLRTKLNAEFEAIAELEKNQKRKIK